MGKVFCNNNRKDRRWTPESMDQQRPQAFVYSFSPFERESGEDLGGLDSHQHMEGRKQVVHREVRKAKVG